MQVIDRGAGFPLVLVPGIQGRWEWIRPAVEALAVSCRVLTFQLCGERASGRPLHGAYGLDDEAERIVKVLDDRGIRRAAICGISFGGLVALRFAARHSDRTAALVVASSPGPGFRLSRRPEKYMRAPLLFGPLFLLQAPGRVGAEVLAALPTWGERARFLSWQARCLVGAPLSPTRMARRAAVIAAHDPAADARRVCAPTLIVTGEPALDYVVSTAGTTEYLDLVPGARHIVLDRTGHLGSITKPHVFAAVVQEFLSQEGDGWARGRAS
jgi:pimeloyl-ACP methyl ester carboxylesterase